MNFFNRNKSRLLTFDQLMDSQFMKHPSHSQVVHRIFNPWVTAVVIFVVSMIYVGQLDSRGNIIFIFSMLPTGFSMALYFMIISTMIGHGVQLHKLTSRWSLLGIPGALILIFPVYFVIVLSAIIYGYTSFDEQAVFGKILGLPLLFGFVMMLLSWRFHGYYVTWYAGQKGLRFYMEREGYSEEEIIERIRVLTNRGMLEYRPGRK